MEVSEMKKSVIAIALAVAATLLVVACNPKTGSGAKTPPGKVIKSAPIGNLTVTLSNDAGQLKSGNQEVMLTFADSSGKPVEVGAVSFNFHMAQMGTMAAMNDQATFTTTETPGIYRGKVNIEMAGEWQAQIAYEGPAGSGKATVTVSAQ
jgi:predicted small secreted protein